MPNHARSHEDSLKVVCASCFCKTLKPKSISIKIENKLKTIIPEYDLNNDWCPSVLCGSCYIKLTIGKLSRTVNYEAVRIRRKRNELNCSCDICQIARGKTKNNAMQYVLEKKLSGRPKLSPELRSTVKICCKCNLKVKRGIKHPCTKTNKVTNCLTLAAGCEQQVTSRILLEEEKKQIASGSGIPSG